MPAPLFRKACKIDARLRMALTGPPGSGKTFTGLALAAGLKAGPVALVDTERGSASKYADQFDFDVLELETFHPERYIEAIQAAEEAAYGVLVIDSLSHAWMGRDGALELVDRAAGRMKSSNSFAAWRDVTPLQNRLLDAILGAKVHIIATMRSRLGYVQERDAKGRTIVRKVGLKAVQRDGVEYEFDVVGDMDQDHCMTIQKSRCPALTGQLYAQPNGQVARLLRDWLQGTPDPVAKTANGNGGAAAGNGLQGGAGPAGKSSNGRGAATAGAEAQSAASMAKAANGHDTTTAGDGLEETVRAVAELLKDPLFKAEERQRALDWMVVHRDPQSLGQLKERILRDLELRQAGAAVAS